jgi:hypothetical protein
LVSEANVTIFKIDARNKNAEEEDGELNEKMAEDGSSFVVLMEEEIDVNLLSLTNGITELLVDGDFPVGEYDLVRVYVRGINVKLTDGTTYDLNVPSGAQTGIKVFLTPPIAVNGGLTSELLLDFDVSSSFIPLGSTESVDGITGFNFTPVIKASNMSTTGTLSGTITTLIDDEADPLEGVEVNVYAEDILVRSTFSDGTGAYTVMGLDAGSYDVEVVLDGYDSQLVEGVEIFAANKTTQDFEMELSAE